MSQHHRRAKWSSASPKIRKRMEPLVRSGGAVCGRCHRPITPDQAWDVGHVVDLSTGLPGAGYQTEHRYKRDCPAGGNRGAGGRLGAAKTNNTRRKQQGIDLRLPDV